MLTRLLEYLDKTPLDAVAGLKIEDVAVAAAWLASYAPAPAPTDRFLNLQVIVSRWLESAETQEHTTEGKRQQLLLRRVLNRVRLDGIKRLNRSELDLLVAVHELLKRVHDSSLFERLHRSLGGEIGYVLEQHRGLRPEPGLPGIEDTVRYVTAEDLEAAKPKRVRYVSGVELPALGPVYTHTGDVRVLDYVPDNCTLVVDQGVCAVSGYVLGRVASTGDCEVQENIAGVVIVSQGHVRARNIIDNAFVVSKWGEVAAKNIENPRLIYGGEHIAVHGKVRLGKCISPQIAVTGAVEGGEHTVSRKFTADKFVVPHSGGFTIFLPMTISSQDYGEAISDAAGRLQARAAACRARMAHLRALCQLTHSESEQFATSGIVFLFGGDSIRRHLDEINGLRRRLAFLDRVIGGIDALTDSVHARMAGRGEGDADTTDDGARIYQSYEEAMEALDTEGDSEADVIAQRTELSRLDLALTKHPLGNVLQQQLTYLREKHVYWSAERDRLAAVLVESQRALNRSLKSTEFARIQTEGQDKVQVLTRVLASVRQKPETSPIAQRSRGNFIRLIARAIQNRHKRQEHYKKLLNELQKEFDACSKQLEEEHHIRLPDFDAQRLAEVIGRFEAGVRLVMDKYVLEMADVPANAILMTNDSRGSFATYKRTLSGIFPASPYHQAFEAAANAVVR